MAIQYATPVKNSRLQAVVKQIDGGKGKGTLEIGTAGMKRVLAVFALDKPSGKVSNGMLSFSGFPKSDTNAATDGKAAEARIRDSDAMDLITGLTVGESDADIVLSNLNIKAGQTVTINSVSIKHA